MVVGLQLVGLRASGRLEQDGGATWLSTAETAVSKGFGSGPDSFEDVGPKNFRDLHSKDSITTDMEADGNSGLGYSFHGLSAIHFHEMCLVFECRSSVEADLPWVQILVPHARKRTASAGLPSLVLKRNSHLTVDGGWTMLDLFLTKGKVFASFVM